MVKIKESQIIASVGKIFYVDGSTTVPVSSRDGSPTRPFATFTAALAAPPTLNPGDARTLLVAPGNYNGESTLNLTDLSIFVKAITPFGILTSVNDSVNMPAVNGGNISLDGIYCNLGGNFQNCNFNNSVVGNLTVANFCNLIAKDSYFNGTGSAFNSIFFNNCTLTSNWNLNSNSVNFKNCELVGSWSNVSVANLDEYTRRNAGFQGWVLNTTPALFIANGSQNWYMPEAGTNTLTLTGGSNYNVMVPTTYLTATATFTLDVSTPPTIGRTVIIDVYDNSNNIDVVNDPTAVTYTINSGGSPTRYVFKSDGTNFLLDHFENL